MIGLLREYGDDVALGGLERQPADEDIRRILMLVVPRTSRIQPAADEQVDLLGIDALDLFYDTIKTVR